jgi:hypothetical protein
VNSIAYKTSFEVDGGDVNGGLGGGSLGAPYISVTRHTVYSCVTVRGTWKHEELDLCIMYIPRQIRSLPKTHIYAEKF